MNIILKQTILFSIIIFLFNINLFAQNEYIKGYIIKDGDTLNCYIKKTPLKDIEHIIKIKTNLSDTTAYLYTTIELDGMYIENFGEFASRKVRIRFAKDIMQSNDRNANDEEKFIDKNLFLKILASGRVNLYYFLDKNMKEHFFVEKDTLFYELYEKKSYKFTTDPGDQRDINRNLVVQKKYLGILSFLLNDYKELHDKILDAKLSQNSLTKLIDEYNLKFNKEHRVKKIKKSKKMKNVLVNPSVFAGLSVNSFHFKGLIYNNVKSFDEPFNKTFTGGAQFNFIFPKFSYNFGITLGVLYAKNDLISSYDTVKYDATYNYESYFIINYYKYSILLKYTFNNLKIKPYIFGGVFLNNAKNINSGVNIIINDGSSETVEYSSFWGIYANSVTQSRPHNRTKENGLSFGLGLKKQLGKNSFFFIESRYDRGNGFIVSEVVSMTSDYINLVAGFEF